MLRIQAKMSINEACNSMASLNLQTHNKRHKLMRLAPPSSLKKKKEKPNFFIPGNSHFAAVKRIKKRRRSGSKTK